jgi:valyl-tRNA synthetase
MESQGRDIKLDEKRVEGYRNFATKLWNAARFLQMNGVGASASIAAPEARLPVNRWIIGEVVETLARLNKAFDELRYDEMADAIYHFTWGTFCDWYVELVKCELSPLPLAGGEEARSAEGEGLSASDTPTQDNPSPSPSREREGSNAAETRAVVAWAFAQILVMLHPLMPFITEELWAAMGERPYELIVAKWPAPQAAVDPQAKAEVEWLIDAVREIRSARTELNIAPGVRLDAIVTDAGDRARQGVSAQGPMIGRLARLNRIEIGDAPAGAKASLAVPDATIVIPLEGVIDVAAERDRLAKATGAVEKERDSLAQRLANPNFTERAKPEAVEKARADHEAKAAEAERLRAALERLG